jgi:hypothetical protein
MMDFKDMGMIALGIFLLLLGLQLLFNLVFSGMNIILGILALAAGVLLLLGPVMATTNRKV